MVINIRPGTAKDGGFDIKNNMHLSRRELETLALIGSGLSDGEVAKKLSLRISTVRNHVWNLMQKLGATSRANAIVLAVQNGIFDIMPNRSLETYVPGSDRYVLCIMCGKAALTDDYEDVESQNVMVNHIGYEVDSPPNVLRPDVMVILHGQLIGI